MAKDQGWNSRKFFGRCHELYPGYMNWDRKKEAVERQKPKHLKEILKNLVARVALVIISGIFYSICTAKFLKKTEETEDKSLPTFK